MQKIIGHANAANSGEVYRTHLEAHQHQFIADEPLEFGGKNAGPSPIDYLCGALASCTAITLRMYAARKKWEVEAVHVKVDLVKGTEMKSGNNTFYCEIKIAGMLDEAQCNRMMEIAKSCPVHRLLAKSSDIISVKIQ